MSIRISYINYADINESEASVENNSTLVTGSSSANIRDTKKPRLITAFDTGGSTVTAYIQIDLGSDKSCSVIALVNHNIVSTNSLFISGTTSAKGAFDTNLAAADPAANPPNSAGQAATFSLPLTHSPTNPTDGSAGTFTVRNTDAPLDSDGVSAGLMSKAIVYLSAATSVRYILVQVVRQSGNTDDLEIGSIWVGNYISTSPTGSHSAQSLGWQLVLKDKSDQVELFNVSGSEVRVAPRYASYRLPFGDFTTTDWGLFKDLWSTCGKSEPFFVGLIPAGTIVDKREFILGRLVDEISLSRGSSDRATFTVSIDELT